MMLNFEISNQQSQNQIGMPNLIDKIKSIWITKADQMMYSESSKNGVQWQFPNSVTELDSVKIPCIIHKSAQVYSNNNHKIERIKIENGN